MRSEKRQVVGKARKKCEAKGEGEERKRRRRRRRNGAFLFAISRCPITEREPDNSSHRVFSSFFPLSTFLSIFIFLVAPSADRSCADCGGNKKARRIAAQRASPTVRGVTSFARNECSARRRTAESAQFFRRFFPVSFQLVSVATTANGKTTQTHGVEHAESPSTVDTPTAMRKHITILI